MKLSRSVEDLAARITAAATAPLQVLESQRPHLEGADADAKTAVTSRAGASKVEEPRTARGKGARKPKAETLGINLRPSRALYQRYVVLAADRSRTEGRMVSAQQIMLEVLERSRA